MKCLTDLPDDCLIQILEFLSLEELCRMRLTCTKFGLLTRSYCPVQYKTWQNDFEDKQDGKIKFNWLFNHMKDSVECLELRGVTNEILSMLNNHIFNKVSTFKLHCLEKCSEIDKTIAKICPNIKHLAFEGCIENVQSFVELNNLISLELYCDDGAAHLLNTANLFESCKLEKFTLQWSGPTRNVLEAFKDIVKCAATLKDLAISGGFFATFLAIVNSLEKLRFFSFVDVELFEGEEGTLDYLFKTIADRVIKFGSSFDYYPLQCNELRKLCNLNEWIIEDRGVSCSNPKNIPTLFRNIRVIRCLNKSTYFLHQPETPTTSEDENEDYSYDPIALSPLSIIAVFDSLETLVIPYVWIGDRFPISELLTILKQQTKRIQALELILLVEPLMNEFDLKEKLPKWEQPGLLNIALQKYPQKRHQHWDGITKHYLTLELSSSK